VAVIGVSLALPAGLFWSLHDLQSGTLGWNKNAKVMLFLHVGTSETQARSLLQGLQKTPGVKKASYISPEEGLKTFEKDIGLRESLSNLAENPLPPLIEIIPNRNIHNAAQMDSFVNSMRMLPLVDIAQMNIEWLQKLYTFVEIIRRAVIAIALLLGLGVLLVVGNTIRLYAENHRDEIDVIKLIGATDAFARRPFLYTGLLYGLLGGVLACILNEALILWLQAPIQQMAILYQSSLQLHFLELDQILGLLGAGSVLGLSGAWLAVIR